MCSHLQFDRQHFDDLISDLRYMEGKKAEDVGGGGGGEDEFFVAGLGGGGGPEGLDGSAAVDKLKVRGETKALEWQGRRLYSVCDLLAAGPWHREPAELLCG